MAPKYSGGYKCGNILYGEAQWRVGYHCNWFQILLGQLTFVLFNESDLEISGDTLKSTKTQHRSWSSND